MSLVVGISIDDELEIYATLGIGIRFRFASLVAETFLFAIILTKASFISIHLSVLYTHCEVTKTPNRMWAIFSRTKDLLVKTPDRTHYAVPVCYE
jgi:hypothetical protein